MAYEDLLNRLGLDEDELVARLLAGFGFNAPQIRNAEPQPIDGWVPTTTSGGAALAPAFARSLNGWEITLTAATPNARLTYSLERLPRQAKISSVRLSYLTDATFPDTNTVEVVAHDRITGATSVLATNALIHSSAALVPMIMTIPLAGKQMNGGQNLETQVHINIQHTVNGAFLRVTGLAATYSFQKSA